MIKNYKLFTESLLNKLKGPSEEEVIKNIENKDLEDQLKVFINNGYMKGILKIKKMFDDKEFYFDDDINGFKNFRHILSFAGVSTESIIDFPDVLELLDKEKMFNIFQIDRMIKESILQSKKESLDYLLKKYNKSAKEIFTNDKNTIYLSNPILKNDIEIVKVILNNGCYDVNPYYYFKKAIKYSGEEMGEMFIKKYTFKESLLNKLEGPTKEEVSDELRKRFENGEISIDNYYITTINLGIDGPTKDEVSDELRKQYESGKMDIETYYNKTMVLNVKGPDKEELKKSLYKKFLNNTIHTFDYIQKCEFFDIELPPKKILIEKLLNIELENDVNNIDEFFELFVKNSKIVISDTGIHKSMDFVIGTKTLAFIMGSQALILDRFLKFMSLIYDISIDDIKNIIKNNSYKYFKKEIKYITKN